MLSTRTTQDADSEWPSMSVIDYVFNASLLLNYMVHQRRDKSYFVHNLVQYSALSKKSRD